MEFSLTPVPPFELGLTVWALRRRAHNRVDLWDGSTYTRAVIVGSKARLMRVVQSGTAEAPRLEVDVPGERFTRDKQRVLTGLLARLLGLHVELAAFYRLADHDPTLAPLVRRFRGLKPPRFPTLFEALVNGIACQQITLDLGITLLNRVAEVFGVKATAHYHAFPRPQELAGCEPPQLRALGFSTNKAHALLDLAADARPDGGAELESIDSLNDEAALRRLLGLRGVGRWTGEYVLLRGLGRTHVFPGDDVGARKRLAQWLQLPMPLDYEAVQRTVSAWYPYAGLVYFHLLLRGLAERKII